MNDLFPRDRPAHVHVVSNRDGASYDTFAYNSLTHDSIYYAYDPTQPIGRRSLSSATDGRRDLTVTLFEDGTATIGMGLRVVEETIAGVAVSVDPRGDVRALVDGEPQAAFALEDDPRMETLLAAGLLDARAVDDLLEAYRRGDLMQLSFVQRGFPAKRVGTDGASYHVPPHLFVEANAIVLEAGATTRPTLPLLVMPVAVAG